nr:RagB/SusD family nutrient uptake outer membrane protein [Hymenobacter sp. AT01-02]
MEAYEYLNGASGELNIRNAAGTDFIYYDNLSGPFANKDARLYGTIIYPGSTFKGQEVQLQAGVKVWNATSNSYQTFEGGLASVYGGAAFPTGDGKLLTGSSGPQANQPEVSNSGFYLRKFIDSGAGTSSRGIRSDVWWVHFRLAEVLLNASEAALELGNTAEAVTYVNRVRERAGFPANSLTTSTLTLARLQNERRVELAFEDHRVWDLKRWRIAHQVWNGNATTLTPWPMCCFLTAWCAPATRATASMYLRKGCRRATVRRATSSHSTTTPSSGTAFSTTIPKSFATPSNSPHHS